MYPSPFSFLSNKRPFFSKLKVVNFERSATTSKAELSSSVTKEIKTQKNVTLDTIKPLHNALKAEEASPIASSQEKELLSSIEAKSSANPLPHPSNQTSAQASNQSSKRGKKKLFTLHPLPPIKKIEPQALLTILQKVDPSLSFTSPKLLPQVAYFFTTQDLFFKKIIEAIEQKLEAQTLLFSSAEDLLKSFQHYKEKKTPPSLTDSLVWITNDSSLYQALHASSVEATKILFLEDPKEYQQNHDKKKLLWKRLQELI